MFNLKLEQNMENKHDHHHELFEKEWQKSQENEIISWLKEGKPLAEKLPELPGFQQAFDHKLDCLDCSDGRVCSGAKMALAGEGILLGESDMKILAEAVKHHGLSVSGHENCGAAALAHPGTDSDRYGYEHAQKLAAETGSEYKEIHRDGFKCPIHNERALVLEGTGRFDVANFAAFPGQFISSASYFGLSEEYQKTEAKALINIALGDHGFGERFDADNPFYLVVSAPDAEHLNTMAALAEEIAGEFSGRVKVEGFVAPAASAE